VTPPGTVHPQEDPTRARDGDVLLSRPHRGHHRDCLRSVPALWRSWLNFRREEPPTEKELEAYEAKQVIGPSSPRP
jgi:hypothetical protein